ncbi:unnamed protein product [Coregonus sp. 'balchen']|nr:unnamed protein product [Coregonus sp. 'balchen']
MAQKLVIIDTDAGIDDAQAIMMSLAAPGLQILGITCCFGNTDVDNVCQNVLRVLSVCERTQIPVFRGAAVPLVGATKAFSHHFGTDGLGDVLEGRDPQWKEKLQREHAVNAMIRLVADNPKQEFFEELINEDTPAGRFMKKITSKCWGYSKEAMLNKRDVYFGPGFVSYDAYAVAACIDSSVVTESIVCAVRVELQGALCRGMMALDPSNRLKKNHCVSVMKTCDLTKFSQLLVASLRQPCSK